MVNISSFYLRLFRILFFVIKMQKINKAKEVLTDPKKRRIYDQNGSLDGPGNIDDTRHPFPGYPGSRKLLEKRNTIDGVFHNYNCLFFSFRFIQWHANTEGTPRQ